MKYVVISGSHRENSQSEKVSNWLLRQLEKRNNHVELLNLSRNPFPLWNQSFWESGSDLQKLMQPTIDLLKIADGLIIVSPEWGGMVPAGLKNLLLYLGQDIIGHKPCLLVGISAVKGGSYPIVELRMSGYKNSKMVYIPDHLVIQEVTGVLNDDTLETDNKADAYIKKRALFSLDVLETYTKTFISIRENKEIFNTDYKFGM
jgi:NAD(P)H-dependent FMN reductase